MNLRDELSEQIEQLDMEANDRVGKSSISHFRHLRRKEREMIDLPTPETDAVAEKNIYGVACKVDVDFARKLEQERDEAREDAADWKIEYEIVVARLRGKKHPNDNGIVAPDEIIPKLTRERDEAREELNRITEAANAVVDRWEQPSWKDTEPTALVIYKLRSVLKEQKK